MIAEFDLMQDYGFYQNKDIEMYIYKAATFLHLSFQFKTNGTQHGVNIVAHLKPYNTLIKFSSNHE